MKLEDQVCSLELAKRLKELGVRQESCFAWNVGAGHLFHWDNGKYGSPTAIYVSAFTVAELGEMLPPEVHFFVGIKARKRRANAQHIHFFHGNGWMVNYTGGGARENYTQRGDTEADARAKMLVYLLENKLITV